MIRGIHNGSSVTVRDYEEKEIESILQTFFSSFKTFCTVSASCYTVSTLHGAQSRSVMIDKPPQICRNNTEIKARFTDAT